MTQAKVNEYDNVSMPAINRCDRCGAQAFMEVVLPKDEEPQPGINEGIEVVRETPLLFCAHHAREHEEKLFLIDGATISDHRPLLQAQEQEATPVQQ